MTDKTKEALKLALEALEGLEALLLSMGLTHLIVYGDAEKAITNLQKELEDQPAQPQQEPVAREHITDGSPCWCEPGTNYKDPETGISVIVHKEPQ